MTEGDICIDYRGWRFFPPFYCGRCGALVSTQQFAFSRTCAGCDCSNSTTALLSIFDNRWLVGKVEKIAKSPEGNDINPNFIRVDSDEGRQLMSGGSISRDFHAKPKPPHPPKTNHTKLNPREGGND